MVSAAAETSPTELLQLVGDPVRWQLLQELARSDRRVNELTELAGRPQNLVSYHLRALRAAGLVSARRSSADGRDLYYRVDLTRCGRLLCATGAALHPGLRLELVNPSPHPVTQGRAPRVLFLCTGNSARSQMAEALLRSMSAGQVDARSAGSHPKALHPSAVRVMAARGIDISVHRTKHLRRYSRTHFDHVITLCDRVREVCPEFPRQPVVAHWSVADPALDADSADATDVPFERAAADLESRVTFLLPQLQPIPTQQESSHAR